MPYITKLNWNINININSVPVLLEISSISIIDIYLYSKYVRTDTDEMNEMIENP